METKDNISENTITEGKTSRGRPKLPGRGRNTVTIIKIYINDNSDYFITATKLNPRHCYSRYKHQISIAQKDDEVYHLKQHVGHLVWKRLDEFKLDENDDGKKQIYNHMKEAILKEKEKCKGNCLNNVDRFLGIKKKRVPTVNYYEKYKEHLSEKIKCDVCDKIISRSTLNSHNQSLKHLRNKELSCAVPK